MNTINDTVNFNSASQEELQQIPGIGPVLANNILKARPFSSFEDIQRVNGIGSNMLERLKSKISISEHEKTQPETSPITTVIEEYPDEPIENMDPEPELEVTTEIEPSVDEIEDSPTNNLEMEEVAIEVNAEEDMEEARTEPPSTRVAPPADKPPKTRSVSPGRLFWTVALFSLLTILLSVSCSLGSLWIINGSIRYARAEQITNLKQQSASLESQLKSQMEDINELQTKLEQVDTFKGQIIDIQKSTSQMQTGLSEAVQQMETLSQDIEKLDTNMEILEMQSARFQRFMDGLRKLINAVEEP